MKGVVMDEYMLSTVDNPYNPFTHFSEWYAWDTISGYNTLSLLARIAQYSDDLFETDADRVIDDAMNEIVEENVSGVHIKVKPTDATPRKQTVQLL